MASNESKTAVLDRLRQSDGYDKSINDSFFRDLQDAMSEIRSDTRADVNSSLVANRARNRASARI